MKDLIIAALAAEIEALQEQVEELSIDFIVVHVDDLENYKPAPIPRVYRSERQANKVADILTEKYDEEFAVFARIR